MANVEIERRKRANTNKQKFSIIGEIINAIATKKNITLTELAKRSGYKEINALRNRMIDGHSMRVDILAKICDSLGVELCIIDGFRKYRISEEQWNPELDLMLNRLDRETDLHSVDKWKERDENDKLTRRAYMANIRESDREAYNAYMNEYHKEQRKKAPLIEDGNLCFRCENYERRIKRNGKGYCPVLDKYIAKSTDSNCEYFNEREENTEEA